MDQANTVRPHTVANTKKITWMRPTHHSAPIYQVDIGAPWWSFRKSTTVMLKNKNQKHKINRTVAAVLFVKCFYERRAITMSCLHPNIYLKYSKTLINKQGEKYNAVKILKESEIYQYELYKPEVYFNFPEKDPYIWEGKRKYKILEVGKTRCGKCDGCKWDNAKEWATRGALESLEYKNNWFITFTYNDEKIPRTEDHEESYTNKFTGEKYEIDDPEATTLWLEDMQTVIRAIRDHWRNCKNHDGIRFYGCGEYGPTTNRPHYHYIFFNLPIEEKDLILLGKNRNGQPLYTHKKIQELWGKGHIALGKVTWESCAYVAQYCTKKKGGSLYGELKERYYKEQGKMPEFTHMSRKPGIGKAYYEKNFWDIYKNDEIIIATKKGVKTIKPSSYYDRLFDLDGYGEYLEELKEKRKQAAQENMECEMSRTTLTEKEYLQQKERTLKDRTKILTREGLQPQLK